VLVLVVVWPVWPVVEAFAGGALVQKGWCCLVSSPVQSAWNQAVGMYMRRMCGDVSLQHSCCSAACCSTASIALLHTLHDSGQWCARSGVQLACLILHACEGGASCIAAL
jgi:hypothetical protein